MRAPAKFLAILFLFVLCNARASTNTSEITDMWWNPAESGWGVNIILQNSVVFATFFVYDANHNPVWYTAPLYKQGSAFVPARSMPRMGLGSAARFRLGLQR